MSSETVKIKGIVIRSNQSGENDRILTLLSNELGRISVIAKGARSLKHKSQGAISPLCYSNFVLKPVKENLYSLTSAELIEGFRTISEDIELLSYGAYFMSLCEMGVQGGMEADEEVRLLLNTLYVLTKRSESAPLVKVVFELKLAELFGIMPEFSPECPCGEKASHFSISDSETRCALHKEEKSIYISPRLITLAQAILEFSLKDALFISASNEDAINLDLIIEPFLRFHLGNLPKSLDFLHNTLKNLNK